MRNTAFSGVAAHCLRGACNLLTGLLLASGAMALLLTAPLAPAQNPKGPAVLPAPSPGKAIVCIYRTYRFMGSAAHDEIFVNDTHLGKLLNSEYMFTEVQAGTVVIAGVNKMYYGSAIMSAGAALNQARQKENERARFEAEAGRTYYFRWTSDPMATGIKVTPVDPDVGAKEMRKLHPSKPPDDTDTTKTENKEQGQSAPQ